MAARVVALAFVCLVVLAGTAAACPCMEGFPAMGHNPQGTMFPHAQPPTVGCGATPVLQDPVDGMVRLPVTASAGPVFGDWRTVPEGPTGIRAIGATLVSGPAGTSAPSAFLAPARADAGGWQANVTFRMGTTAQDPVGNASFSVRFAVMDRDARNVRAGPALRLDIDNHGGEDYPVAAPNGAFLVRDDVPHNLSFWQDDLALHVTLDGHALSTTDPIGRTDECTLLGFSGPTSARTQPVILSGFALRSLPDPAANQRLSYGFAPEEPPVNPTDAPVDACAVPAVRCNLIEGMALRESVARCDKQTGLVLEPKKGNEPNLQAANAVLSRFGCGPDWRARAVLWQVADGLHEAEAAAWPHPDGARLLHYTDTDTVMYGPDGATTFGCDLIREYILVQMHYTPDELAAAGMAEDQLGLFHWDGHSLHALVNKTKVDTDLGTLLVVEAGHDHAHRVLWAIVKIERTVEGRALNADYATIKKSDGHILGNGYMLGQYTPPRSTPAPPAIEVLVCLALLVAVRRGRRPGDPARSNEGA